MGGSVAESDRVVWFLGDSVPQGTATVAVQYREDIAGTY